MQVNNVVTKSEHFAAYIYFLQIYLLSSYSPHGLSFHTACSDFIRLSIFGVGVLCFCSLVFIFLALLHSSFPAVPSTLLYILVFFSFMSEVYMFNSCFIIAFLSLSRLVRYIPSLFAEISFQWSVRLICFYLQGTNFRNRM